MRHSQVNKMKLFLLASLFIISSLPATAAQKLSLHYQKHYACTLIFSGESIRSQDLYTAINARSGAMTLQRAGSQVYYAKKVSADTWLEINPDPSLAAEFIRVGSDGTLDTYQANTKVSTCIEVE